jgi:phosphoribosylformylglycinamidine cyclo-ligase
MIEPHAIVLGGSGAGVVNPKSKLLLGTNVQAGDAILLAKATGIHTNGLTLARKVAADLPKGYATPVRGDPDGRGFGEVLLDPTPLYGPLVQALQDDGVGLHYDAHVTGHGWRKLMRSPNPLTYVVERLPEIPPVFDLLCREARMDPRQAYGTFNMGAGFALFVASSNASRACHVASTQKSLALENLALRHQLGVLKRTVGNSSIRDCACTGRIPPMRARSCCRRPIGGERRSSRSVRARWHGRIELLRTWARAR